MKLGAFRGLIFAVDFHYVSSTQDIRQVGMQADPRTDRK